MRFTLLWTRTCQGHDGWLSTLGCRSTVCTEQRQVAAVPSHALSALSGAAGKVSGGMAVCGLLRLCLGDASAISGTASAAACCSSGSGGAALGASLASCSCCLARAGMPSSFRSGKPSSWVKIGTTTAFGDLQPIEQPVTLAYERAFCLLMLVQHKPLLVASLIHPQQKTAGWGHGRRAHWATVEGCAVR